MTTSENPEGLTLYVTGYINVMPDETSAEVLGRLGREV